MTIRKFKRAFRYSFWVLRQTYSLRLAAKAFRLIQAGKVPFLYMRPKP